MITRATAALLLASVAIAACEEKPKTPPLPQTSQESGTALFQEQRQALDKAKGVEQVLQQHDQEQKQAEQASQ
jgi:hypothetical protein